MRPQWQQWQQQQQRRMQQQREMGYAWQQWQKAKKKAQKDAVQPLVVPLSVQAAANVHAVSPSAVVYLHGHRFVGKGSFLKDRTEIPCHGVKVGTSELAQTAVATAFIALDRSGYVTLYLGTRRATLALSGLKAVCLKPTESGIVTTGLEGRILDSLRDRRTRNNTYSIVRRTWRTHPIAVIAQIRGDLLEQGYFHGRGKMAKALLGEKLVPDCQRIAALEGHVESVRNMVEAFRRADPAIYSQLLNDIRAAMK